MNSHILQTFGLNLMVAELILKDLTDEQMTVQPSGLINHPAWSLGHLVCSAHEALEVAGIESSLPDGWNEKFMRGATPIPDPAQNPSKDELLGEFRAAHERVSSAFPSLDTAILTKEHPSEGARPFFPTIGDHVIYMMTAHEMDHLGQLAAWRRAMGLKPAM